MKKYDKTLKTEQDKELWNFLQGGIFSDNRDKCKYLRKQGYSKKQIVDSFRPIYNAMKSAVEDIIEKND